MLLLFQDFELNAFEEILEYVVNYSGKTDTRNKIFKKREREKKTRNFDIWFWLFVSFRSWLEKCLLLKRRNLFLSLMKAIMKGPETSESVHLPLTIRQGPWNDLTALAARTQQSVELEMLLQYGTISFSELFKREY